MLFQEDKHPGEILNFLLPQECRNSVALPKLLGANLFVTGLFTLLFGVYSVCVTLLTGILVGLPGLPRYWYGAVGFRSWRQHLQYTLFVCL